MKNWYSLLTILVIMAFSACKKEKCLYCTAYLTNASQRGATVSVDGIGMHRIEPGQTRPEDLSNHTKQHRIQVIFDDSFDYDYDFIQGCSENCEDIKILLED
jgi:hypothetical protein